MATIQTPSDMLIDTNQLTVLENQDATTRKSEQKT